MQDMMRETYENNIETKSSKEISEYMNFMYNIYPEKFIDRIKSDMITYKENDGALTYYILKKDEVKHCANCIKKNVKFQKCAKCLKTYYCNKECQYNHWHLHKLICK